jgi:membrane protease YdiL (CAAX protease family)
MFFLRKGENKKIFFSLWILCIIGSWAVFPYVQYLRILPASVSFGKFFFLGTIQSAIFFGIVCLLSFKIFPKTDLLPFLFQNPLMRVVCPAIISGILVGVAILSADKFLFHSALLLDIHPPFWMGILASIYGGINEEVLLRFFLFTLLYFLLCKSVKVTKQNRTLFLWIVNVVVATLFGLGHLPAAFALRAPSAFEIFRILFLNGIAGLIFGWLYWSRGLWTAIASHFVTDLMIHVFF